MKEEMTRKDFFKSSVKYAAGAAAGAAGLSLITPENSIANGLVDWPLTYTKLDVEQCRKDTHDLFWTGGGCGYAGFAGIVTALQAIASTGDPILGIPAEMLKFAGGGVAGWGTICGALNSAAAAIGLVTGSTADPNYSTLISELLGWYTQTNLPTDASNTLGSTSGGYDEEKILGVLPQNQSGGSPLCHISVSSWCAAARAETSYTGDWDVGSNARKERCARLSGDVVAYAVQILNDAYDGTFTAGYTAPTLIASCNVCHGATGYEPNVASKMECSMCHGTDTYPHTTSKVEHVPSNSFGYELKNNYPNPFNPSTKIELSLPKRSNVNISIYDVHGRLVKDLVNNTEYPQGKLIVEWSGKNDLGQKVASGTYFYRVKAGTFSKTQKMVMMK